ncbi:MAG: hypothetical protein LBD09_02585 [Treponema sp.]|nr:hypothetical protein [Treponema sp.]
MKPFPALPLLVLGLVLLGPGGEAQESPGGENWDIDSLFNGGDNGVVSVEEPDEPRIPTMRDRVIIEASYNFMGGFSPGWDTAPWHGDGDYSYILGAKLEALLSMDFQLSQYLRVWNAFSFSVPDNKVFNIKEFYFDYNFGWRAFLRAGLCETAWGISPNYPFTNLPARIPAGAHTKSESVGDAYLAKLDIPMGIGGFQFLAMTRYGYMCDPGSPDFDEFAYGAKYNLAWETADIDAGVLYFYNTPLRFFVSMKTTAGNTELYAEGLAAVNYETWEELHFSGNIGFMKDFFNGRLSLNGEVFYNGEPHSTWWRPKSDALDEDAVDLIEGLNTALAFIYRPGFLGLRIFCQGLYAVDDESAWLIPGISVRHGDQLAATITVPMALGHRGGTYYTSNMDKEGRAFSVTLAISFSGSFRYSLL